MKEEKRYKRTSNGLPMPDPDCCPDAVIMSEIERLKLTKALERMIKNRGFKQPDIFERGIGNKKYL